MGCSVDVLSQIVPSLDGLSFNYSPTLSIATHHPLTQYFKHVGVFIDISTHKGMVNACRSLHQKLYTLFRAVNIIRQVSLPKFTPFLWFKSKTSDDSNNFFLGNM